MGGTLTKAALVERLHDRLGLTRREGALLVDELFEQMRLAFDRGEEVKISAFGAFRVREKSARRGRNPQTAEPMTLDERRVLTFKPSTLLRERLNAERGLG